MNTTAQPKAWGWPCATAPNGLRTRARSAEPYMASFMSLTRMQEVPTGATGKLWFKTASPFEYFNDPVKTAEANSPDRTMSTVGDIGHFDEDGYVYLTDRAAFMIISGGVNIYPQECENLLVTHPKVADAAVFGAPNEEMGEEVKAVVQLAPGFEAGGSSLTNSWRSAASGSPTTNVRVRSISRMSCRASRPASSTRAPYANATGRGTKAGSL